MPISSESSEIFILLTSGSNKRLVPLVPDGDAVAGAEPFRVLKEPGRPRDDPARQQLFKINFTNAALSNSILPFPTSPYLYFGKLNTNKINGL